jgi:hypothetical protein
MKKKKDRQKIDKKGLLIDNPVGISKTVETDPFKLSLLHPVKIIEQIDLCLNSIEKFTKSHRNSLTFEEWAELWKLIDIEFGKWSHDLNAGIRDKIKETLEYAKSPDKLLSNDQKILADMNKKYSWAYAYWWNRFHYLENILKSKTGATKWLYFKKLERGRDTLHKLINDVISPDKIHPKFFAAVDFFLKELFK